ncbi:MAG: response regulator transcription factor [Emcibacter sp.]|nr:response regulator transcription factor [Emcibacter sp.]
MKKILIVEDIAETQKWFENIINDTFINNEVTIASTVSEGINSSNQKNFDLALIDLGLPDGSGLKVLRHIKSNFPETLCVITTVMGDDAHIVSALSAGAQGYLLKEQPAEMINKQLIQLIEGIPALSPSIAQRIMKHFRLTGPAAEAESNLTTREQEVLALIGRGMRNVDVADALKLAETTVASHIKSIYQKLGISSRAEASWHATQLGLSTDLNGNS